MTNELHLDSIKEKMVAYLNEHSATLESDSGDEVATTRWQAILHENAEKRLQFQASCSLKSSDSFSISFVVIQIDDKTLQVNHASSSGSTYKTTSFFEAPGCAVVRQALRHVIDELGLPFIVI